MENQRAITDPKCAFDTHRALYVGQECPTPYCPVNTNLKGEE
jgi:hypothetical protein